MNKYCYIEIRSFKGIDKVELKNLKRINVFCGKNNSGKSTILKAISQNAISIGIPTSKLSLENIYLEIERKHFIWDADDATGTYVKIPKFDIDPESWKAYDVLMKYKVFETFIKLNPIVKNSDFGIFVNAILQYITAQGVVIDYEHIDDIDDYFSLPLPEYLEENINDNRLSNENDRQIQDEFSYEDPVETPSVKSLSKPPQEKEQIIKRKLEYILKIYYDEMVKFSGKPLLIDAKRDVTPSFSISESGKNKNILKHLFYLKNSIQHSDRKCYLNLRRVFKEITDGYEFKIISDRDFNLSLSFLHPTGELYSADDCGLGLRDLLLILSYVILTKDHLILLIEEPENHLHPSLQRKLLDFIKRKTNKQFFITTHSNVFLDVNFVDMVYQVYYEDKKIQVSDTTSKASLLSDLGYSISDNLLADMVILVEGPSDKMILEEFFSKLGIYAKYDLKIWALGGGIMNKHDLSVFTSTYRVRAIIDSDPEEDRGDFENECKNLGIPITKLVRYAIENYFTIKALKKVFGKQVKANDQTIIKAEIKLTEQGLGEFNPKRKDYPRKIANAMEMDDIKDTDLYQFIISVKTELEQLSTK